METATTSFFSVLLAPLGERGGDAYAVLSKSGPFRDDAVLAGALSVAAVESAACGFPENGFLECASAFVVPGGQAVDVFAEAWAVAMEEPNVDSAHRGTVNRHI